MPANSIIESVVVMCNTDRSFYGFKVIFGKFYAREEVYPIQRPISQIRIIYLDSLIDNEVVSDFINAFSTMALYAALCVRIWHLVKKYPREK